MNFHHMLLKAHIQFRNRVRNCTQEHGLTVGQPKIIEYLAEVGVSDQKTIAKHCEIEPATVGSILNRMEDSGLIVRKRENGNRRSLFVSLTEKGKQASIVTRDIFLEAEEQALQGLSEEDKQKLIEMLHTVYENLKQEGDIE